MENGLIQGIVILETDPSLSRCYMKQFKKVDVLFSLRDIGSEIIDQLSSDVYTGPGSIFRELVKNAYDAYLAMKAEDLEVEGIKRQIVISRDRDEHGVGHILIDDQGIGQSQDDLKANVQISISRKRQELENATGFRGLGSWATLGAGSKITITSSKKDDPFENRLVINVRKIYQILGPTTTLDDILNNADCILFSQRPTELNVHFTTVEIECDGRVDSINGHEFNRLYAFTDPADTSLRKQIIENCPIPFAKDGDLYKQIHTIYDEIGYHPTPVIFEAKTLERRLPEKIVNIVTEKLKIGGKVAAIAWAADDPTASREVSRHIDDDHHLSKPSIQLMKLNVPIGQKGLFSENVRSGILDWYVGEVHILAPDVLPNAGGDGLRDGSGRDAFVAEVQAFYTVLEEAAEKKSERLSLAKHFRKAQEAARRLQEGDLTPVQETQEKAKVGKAVEIFETLGKRSPPATQQEKRTREAAKDPDVAKEYKEAKKVLRDTGLLDELSKGTSKDKQPKKKEKPASGGGTRDADDEKRPAGASDFQARVARKIPQLTALGLNKRQVEGVLDIIKDLFEEM